MFHPDKHAAATDKEKKVPNNSILFQTFFYNNKMFTIFLRLFALFSRFDTLNKNSTSDQFVLKKLLMNINEVFVLGNGRKDEGYK